MIGQAVRHGRNQRDARNLHAHLMKDKGARIEILNSAADDLQSAMSDMQLLRDGSKADAAFLHLSISPATEMSDDQLRSAAGIVLKHFNAENNPVALVFHDKDRASGKGNKHLHLVVSRVDYEGKVLPSGFEKIRLETAMRIAEFELGENPTLGRHHGSAIKWLQNNNRNDVAGWLNNFHGKNPEKPQSPVSPIGRQKIERVTGTDLATVTMSVADAWAKSDDSRSFNNALAEYGLEVQKGQKKGVYIILKDGSELGALDRILKQKRGVVAQKLEDFNHDNRDEYRNSSEKENNAHAGAEIGSYGGKDRETTNREPTASFEPSGQARRREQSNQKDTGSARTNHIESATPVSDDGRPGQKSRRFDEIKAMREINQASGWDKIRDLTDQLKKMIEAAAKKIRGSDTSDRDNNIASIFEKAVRFSAENMEKLEKLDPALSAFREHYSGRLSRFSKDDILKNMEKWRIQGENIIKNYNCDIIISNKGDRLKI